MYLGNLFMENNRVGLCWFLDQVLPIARLARPALRVVVAGTSNDPGFEARLGASGAVVLPNVSQSARMLEMAKVAVNPIFSGNGANIKTIDALWSGCGLS